MIVKHQSRRGEKSDELTSLPQRYDGRSQFEDLLERNFDAQVDCFGEISVSWSPFSYDHVHGAVDLINFFQTEYSIKYSPTITPDLMYLLIHTLYFSSF
jgi:hypothetical protein